MDPTGGILDASRAPCLTWQVEKGFLSSYESSGEPESDSIEFVESKLDSKEPKRLNENTANFVYFSAPLIYCINQDFHNFNENKEEEIPLALKSLIHREEERHAKSCIDERIAIKLGIEKDPRLVQIRKKLDYETRYTPLEKASLIWATRKLRHYLLAHSIILVSILDPFKYLFEKSVLMGRVVRWWLLLSEFHLQYVTRKSVKRRAIVEFLVDHPVEGNEVVEYLFIDEDILQVEEKTWTMYFDRASNQYIYGIWANAKDKWEIRHLAVQFIICGANLYKRGRLGMHMLCVEEEESKCLMEAIHGGECRPHMNGMMLARKIDKHDYYWSTMEEDCISLVRRCHKCSIHANRMNIPLSMLYNMTSPWTLPVWGIDVISAVSPNGSNGHEFILVAIDDFTKWVEGQSYAVLKASHAAKFIKNNIICQKGLLNKVISDNSSHFKNDVVDLHEKYNVAFHKSLTYRPQSNEAVQAANKNVKNIL
ncbi:uncharacterized protein LOC114304566 [Camellia sinensis]|uniref:uncharacterized protein LOC114304566 n=1 Tax=Camellia sinensis TaxID=4442 RepID=UPI001035C492|nr:uncharacterized protein LOC114304566 [Camellia sinensis]